MPLVTQPPTYDHKYDILFSLSDLFEANVREMLLVRRILGFGCSGEDLVGTGVAVWSA